MSTEVAPHPPLRSTEPESSAGAINDESGVADNHSVEVARAEKRRVANETR